MASSPYVVRHRATGLKDVSRAATRVFDRRNTNSETAAAAAAAMSCSRSDITRH